jgi:hypothetical protein
MERDGRIRERVFQLFSADGNEPVKGEWKLKNQKIHLPAVNYAPYTIRVRSFGPGKER